MTNLETENLSIVIVTFKRGRSVDDPFTRLLQQHIEKSYRFGQKVFTLKVVVKELSGYVFPNCFLRDMY